MASNQSIVDLMAERMAGAGVITTRKMFGEHAIYCGTKLVALVCDDRLFVKPTPAGRAFIGTPVEAPPYPGAKPSFLIEDWERAEWLSELVRRTEAALPQPAPRKPRRAD